MTRFPFGFVGGILPSMLIEVFADVVCPWCYIGKHRLERALEERRLRDVTIKWLPFQLNPDMIASGMERSAYLTLKFGSRERALQVSSMLEQTAERDGLPLDLDAIQRTPNTVDAHRMIRLAARHNVEAGMVNALFEAYFVLGLDISDHEILAELAAELGINEQDALGYLAGHDDAAAVRNSDIRARRLGIHAVPCFIIDQRYALAGAHDPETFSPLFDLAAIGGLNGQDQASGLIDQMASLSFR